MMTKKNWLSSTVVWSILASFLLFLIYLLPAYRRSVEEYSINSVLLNMRADLLTPSLFWAQMAYYLLMLFLFHFVFFYCLAEVVRIRHNGKKRAVFTLLLWIVGLLFLHTVNSGFFPHSSLAFELAFGIIMPVLAATILAVLLVIGVGHIWFRGMLRFGIRWWLPSCLMLLAWSGSGVVGWVMAGSQGTLPQGKPNIIMIGIDGLRPDRLAYMHAFDPSYQGPMPFLDKQLAKSVVFAQAYSPVARTYPAWMAILTGLDPLHSGVRANLQDDYGWWQGKMHTLPQYLNQHGYQTAWAIDDTTFANIGHRHGFDQVVMPDPGAAFYIVKAFMADIPLVNLLSNSAYGDLLFPLTSVNRALGFSYYPYVFSNRVNDLVSEADPERPLFLAIHFELAHYPMIWADDSVPDYIADNFHELGFFGKYYLLTLSQIDRQINSLMMSLKAQGRLQNAIVIFLSDHGNGLFTGKMGKNRFGQKVYIGDDSSGHGTDVTNLTQQHALLAIRGYGSYVLEQGYRDNIVSLMDITPTLLKIMGIEPNEPMQGIPLDILGVIPERRRVVFFESGVHFSGLASGKINLKANLAEQVNAYRIHSNGRMVIRNGVLPEVLKKKARSAYDGNYIVAQAWNYEKNKYGVGAFNRKTGEKYDFTVETLLLPGMAQLSYEFCHHYSKNDPYFTPPAFCNVLKVKDQVVSNR